MRIIARLLSAILVAVSSFTLVMPSSVTAGQAVRGHVPGAVAALKPIGHLTKTNGLDLVIGLPLRNADGLGQFVKQIYDPASPNFHHYLTPARFTEQFGPSQADYDAVAAFAATHGLKVTGRHPNRMLLDVNGSVADVERTLHVKMQLYQHPTEARTFYAADSDPSMDLATPVLDVSGLENYSLPKPRLAFKPQVAGENAQANVGSGPSGNYMGGDFRAAYVPDTTLTGAGQVVGLLQFDGYTASDITYYESLAGLPNVPLSNVLLDNFGGQPTGSGGEVEVSLDIEMSMSMAPGLSKIIVYMAGPYGNWHDILNRMTTDNLAKQMSCSWYIYNGAPDPVAEQIFQEMAAQGQTFFAASGDYDAYTGLIPFPGDSTNITEVGGTTLTTTGPGGAWASETVWNWGNGIGSAGGISTSYAIPGYQTNISMTANLGSTTRRNIPDVALTADNVYVRADGRNFTGVGGTSCAAPLWAGFTALVNQEATTSGRPTVGFINPALDMIGSGPTYTNCFHDITTGNNFSPSSPQKFPAVAGYDLCTGWGVPAGQNLINALAIPDALGVQPDSGFTSAGGSGGPFTMLSENFVLTNSGTNSLNWSLVSTSSWLAVSPLGGTLVVGGSDATPVVSLSAAAYSLPLGTYSSFVAFSNVTTGIAQTRQFTLQIVPSVPPTIVTGPVSQSIAVGSNATFGVTAGGTPPLNYQWQVNTTNINGATNSTLPVSNVGLSDAGTYTITVTNTHGSTNATATLTVGYPPSISVQPQDQDVAKGSNASFMVTAGGDSLLSYQWSFNGLPLAQAANSTLVVTNAQSVNGGVYRVAISNPFGAAVSSNANLTIETPPVIVIQPQSQNEAAGGNVAFAVVASGATATLPPVSTGTLELWLKADYGVITNVSGQVSQWQDQSGNTNHAFQSNSNLQPQWISAAGLSGQPVVRFNGIQNNVNGDFLHGSGNVGWSNALTAFTVYDVFATNNENVIWDVGIPGSAGVSRGDMLSGGQLDFIFWSDDYVAPFVVPTNTYRIRTDRLDTNDTTLNVFDYSANGSTNFNFSVTGTGAPGAGYYVGGLDSSLPYVGASRNFNGDIAEWICYQGYLSDADRLAVFGYLEQKYLLGGSPSGLAYQWQFDGTNIANATNSFLSLSNIQATNNGSYTVIVSNLLGIVTSSNAVLTVGNAPSISGQPLSQEIPQGSNVFFAVTAAGDQPLNYQWLFDGVALAQATNSTLSLSNIQATNAGSYSVSVTNLFGVVISSNAVLTVDLPPVIVTQPQNQAVLVGSNVSFSVGLAGQTLPLTASGTVQLWLKADAGVVTNAAGQVSQWQDQSGNTNQAFQSNSNLQPRLVSAAGLFGRPVIRFNGVQNSTNGDYLHGTGNVGCANALTAFTVYNVFATNNENVVWDVGVPGLGGASRGDMLSAGRLDFIFWSDDYVAPFVAPTNTYRIRADRLDANSATLNVFDYSANSSTNFAFSVTGAAMPGAGYYVGGLDSSLPGVGASRNFNGDIAELICYQGYLSDPDRLAVTTYLEQKYFLNSGAGAVSYQWQFDGTNIANATNSSLNLTNVQLTNAGTYAVVVSNSLGYVASSNAVLLVGTSPSITNPTHEPGSRPGDQRLVLRRCRWHRAI